MSATATNIQNNAQNVASAVEKIRAKRSIVNPIRQRDFDYITTDLFQLIGSQQNKDFLGKIPLLDNIVSKEEWLNGIALRQEQGLFTIKDHQKTTTIDEWNPEDNKHNPVIFKVSKRKKTSYVVWPNDFQTIGLNSVKLAEYLMIRHKKNLDTFKVFFFEEICKVLAQAPAITEADVEAAKAQGRTIFATPGAELTFTYDKEITGDIATADKTRALVRAIREQLVSFQTPSNEHTDFGRTRGNESYKTCYNVSDFTLVLDKKFYGARGEMLADIFNKDEVMINVKKEYIDFSLCKFLGDAMKDVYGFLVHKEALTLGSNVNDFVWDFRGPDGKTIKELHNWYGFARWLGAPIIKIKKG